MSDLVPRSSFAPSRLERSTSRSLDRVRADQVVRSAQEAAKLEVIADVTETALMATSAISAMEAILVARTPHAEGRLRHIADAGTLGMAAVVAKAARTAL